MKERLIIFGLIILLAVSVEMIRDMSNRQQVIKSIEKVHITKGPITISDSLSQPRKFVILGDYESLITLSDGVTVCNMDFSRYMHEIDYTVPVGVYFK